MSRIGNVPIPVPKGVTVNVTPASIVQVKGPKGELAVDTRGNVKVAVADGAIKVDRHGEERHHRAFHGLYHRLIGSAVQGVTQGYQKTLEMSGVGYKAELRGTTLILNCGYSHEVRHVPHPGVKITLTDPTHIVVTGIDKQVVGQEAAKIRSAAPPEPYKGKGIKYSDEVVRRKVGKKAK